MDLREEIRIIVNENFNFIFNSRQVPMSRTKFINLLTKEVNEIINKSRVEKSGLKYFIHFSEKIDLKKN